MGYSPSPSFKLAAKLMEYSNEQVGRETSLSREEVYPLHDSWWIWLKRQTSSEAKSGSQQRWSVWLCWHSSTVHPQQRSAFTLENIISLRYNTHGGVKKQHLVWNESNWFCHCLCNFFFIRNKVILSTLFTFFNTLCHSDQILKHLHFVCLS